MNFSRYIDKKLLVTMVVAAVVISVVGIALSGVNNATAKKVANNL